MLYIGQTNGIHDNRFIRAMEECFDVDTVFISDQNNSADVNFGKYDLIVAAPLTETISLVPEGEQTPIAGISLAYDVNSEIDQEMLKTNIRRCKVIICDCLYIRDKISMKYGFNPMNIDVIPFGCDYKLFESKTPREYMKTNILVTRNWSPIHSNTVILDALQLLYDQGVDFNCTFVGDGPELQNAKHKVSNSSMSSKIVFVGSQSPEGISKLMKENDFYISASISDGSSVSLMEAMTSGMVCIVSDFPSNLEWIQHHKSGYLFQNGSRESLSLELKGVLESDPQKLTSIGKVGQKIAETKANWESNKINFKASLESAIA